MIIDIAKKNRSYRRFDNSVKISVEQLRSYIEAARFSASACNFQRLRFCIVSDEERSNALFGMIKFAGFLRDWEGPMPHERPAAYIVIMSDSELNTDRAIDMGIAAEAILMAATESGYGGCMIRNFSKEKLSVLLGKAPYNPELVIALGKPAETVKLVDVKDGDTKYYRDENSVHYVPKLTLEELLLG